jgi:hypothetical protein
MGVVWTRNYGMFPVAKCKQHVRYVMTVEEGAHASMLPVVLNLRGAKNVGTKGGSRLSMSDGT